MFQIFLPPSSLIQNIWQQFIETSLAVKKGKEENVNWREILQINIKLKLSAILYFIFVGLELLVLIPAPMIRGDNNNKTEEFK